MTHAHPSVILHDMSCVEMRAHGGPAVLNVGHRPRPLPADHEVLIKVVAAGVNRGDTVQRQGFYPPPEGASDLLGLEVSGHVCAVGKDVRHWKEGDAVCALLPGGGYAEYCVAHEDLCLSVPESMPLRDAAALPEACFTAWTMIWQLGRLAPQETLLIHGGASGVGTLAIRMAAALGHPVYATAGTLAKCELCVALGASAAIHYKEEDFVKRSLELTAGKGVDVILDMVGGDYVGRDLKAAAEGGRIVLIAFQGGRNASFDIARMMTRRISIMGATLRSRPVSFKADIARALKEHIWPLLESGQIYPVIDSVYTFNAAAQAHARMERGASMGKILLQPS